MSDEKKIITKEHEYYFTPSDGMAERYLARNNIDACNTEFFQEMARFYYHQMVQEQDYIKEEFVNLDDLGPDIDPGKLAGKMAFYDKLYGEYMPGYSPAEKASNALYLLSLEKKKKNPEQKHLDDDLEAETKRMTERLPDKETFECTSWNKLLNTRGLDKFPTKIDYLNKVAIVEGFGKSFEIKKTTEHKKVHNSNKFRQMRLTEYSEIIKSPIYQRIFPNFRAKLLAKDLSINSPIRTEESKQQIIILVDFSGSMRQTFKQEWVLAILADRLYYAMKEECEIFFSFFIEDLYPSNNFVHIYNEETALEFFKKFNICPSGGDTKIGHIINKIKVEVEGSKKLFNLKIDLSKSMPEILVINDGEDTCKVANFTWKANAITLGSRNPELKKLVEDSGGRYITIDWNGKLGE